jgi:regulation of enolase protein 1 (concanavalin A-like superfamily)
MHDRRYANALGLLAILAAVPASAGWVRASWSPSPGVTALRSGCVAPGQYERSPVPIAGNVAGSVTVEGLPDSGRCYFALNAGPQDEWLYDFTALVGGPAAPGPVVNLAVTSAPSLPSPAFQSSDIGPVAAPGSFSEAAGTFTLRASGADIWGTSDQFRFAYRSLNGNGEIVARVASVTNTDPWTKAGVMIRESLTANSKYAFAMVTAGNGVDFQRRLTTGGAAGVSGTSDSVTRAPYWVRIVRTGDLFQGYVSANGTTWTLRGSATIPMATAYIGLALTSHSNSSLATATFTGVAP